MTTKKVDESETPDVFSYPGEKFDNEKLSKSLGILKNTHD